MNRFPPMRTPEEFDEIRPYDPEELPGVFEELINDPEFRAAAVQVMPDTPYEEVCARLRRCRTSLEVQQTIFYPLLHDIVRRYSDGLVMENSSSVDKRAAHTFVTNHRDIVMDSAFLSICLLDNGFGNTVEIAIGDNLLIRPWIKRLVRVDKAFIVERSTSLHRMLESGLRLSRYMHYAVTVKHENVWIAQREGRAKDSNDRTQVSILKMMAMGGEGSPVERLKQLNLVPTTLSYEYDPCDYLKAKEFQQKRDAEDFKKSPADDLESMRTGIFGYKGRICFRVAGPLNDWLETLPADMPKADLFAAVASRIDSEIHHNYRLYAGNYIAADLLRGTGEFAAHYTSGEKARFEVYLEDRLRKVVLPRPDMPFLRERLLAMYANPVFNYVEAHGK